MFCPDQENVDHLFFGCPLAKYPWSLVAVVIGAPCRPNSFSLLSSTGNGQHSFWTRDKKFIWWGWQPFVGLSGHPEIKFALIKKTCTASSFLTYWAELKDEGDSEALEDGVAALKETALQFHPHQAPEDSGMMLGYLCLSPVFLSVWWVFAFGRGCCGL